MKGAWSNWRLWAVLLGALILSAVVFDMLERLVDPGTSGQRGEVASDSAPPLAPIRPEVTKRGSSGVRVVVEGGYRMTQNYHEEAVADRMIACLEDGITNSPALTEEEARAKQVWHEVIRIHNSCTISLDLTPPDGRAWSM